jgi:hypothetical protein
MRRLLVFAISGAVLVGTGVATAKTVRGTPGNDTLVGTPRADRISALGGDDEVYGGQGDDRLDGGAGKDHIWGGDGDDVIVGGPAGDLARRTPSTRHERIFGGAGDDVIIMRVAGSILFAGPGDDRIDVRDPQNACRTTMHPPTWSPERKLDPPHCVNIVNTGPGDNFVRADDGSLDSVGCLGRRDRVIIDQYDSVGPECTVVRRVRL